MIPLTPDHHTKTPNEIHTLSIDWSGTLSGSVELASVSVKVYDKYGTDKTSDILQDTAYISGNYTIFTVKGGELGENYYIKIGVTLSNGNYLEAELPLYIRDRKIFHTT